MLKNTEQNYGLIAKIIHWSSALIILALLPVGFFMTQMDFSPLKLQIYGLHKSFGILVLMLVGLRIIWKLVNANPKHLDTHQAWEVFLAKIVHVLLYAAMIAMPLSGWLMSSAGGFPAGFFGLFELPPLSSKDEVLFELAKQIHEISAFIIIAIVGLHVAGAFKHHFIDQDETLQRMTSQSVGFLGGLGLVLITGVLLAIPTYFIVINYVKLNKGEGEQITAVIEQNDVAVVAATSQAWTINHETSHIQFEATQDGQPFTGFFGFDGEIHFDPQDLGGAKADITIDIASIDTGAADRDEQARGGEWFDVVSFPQARFVTTEFIHQGANRYLSRGDLTLRGVTLPVELPFTLDITEKDGGQRFAQMSGELELLRSDFGVGQGQWESDEAIGNAVKITVRVEAAQF